MKSLLFPHFLGRVGFFARFVLLDVGMVLCLLAGLSAHGIQHGIPANLQIVLPIMLVLMAWGVFGVFLPRIRDTGLPVWTFLFSCIPILSDVFGIFLLLMPSRRPGVSKFIDNSAPASPSPPNGVSPVPGAS